MTHPALEARASDALKVDGDITFPVTMPGDLCRAILKAARAVNTSPTKLIIDILRDAFPSEAPR